jgi:hypothetical protein
MATAVCWSCGGKNSPGYKFCKSRIIKLAWKKTFFTCFESRLWSTAEEGRAKEGGAQEGRAQERCGLEMP